MHRKYHWGKTTKAYSALATPLLLHIFMEEVSLHTSLDLSCRGSLGVKAKEGRLGFIFYNIPSVCHFTLTCPFHPNKGQIPTEGFIHTDNFWAQFLPEIRFGWILTTTTAIKLFPTYFYTGNVATVLRKFRTSLSCLTAAPITSYLAGNRMNLTSRHFCSSCPSLSSFSCSQKILFSKKIPLF